MVDYRLLETVIVGIINTIICGCGKDWIFGFILVFENFQEFMDACLLGIRIEFYRFGNDITFHGSCPDGEPNYLVTLIFG